MDDYNEFYRDLTDKQLEMLKDHLNKRFEYRKSSNTFGIVYDILHQCDLQCRGCGTDASFTYDKCVYDAIPNIIEIESVFEKINTYAHEKKVPVFINIGGGEPFLRHDIIDVLKLASEYFGVQGVGVDTNGTLDNSYDLICQALDYVSYVGISINGLEEYHNWWSGNSKINTFERSKKTVEHLCKDESTRKKIEVTSIATKKNISELPILMDKLVEIDVTNYSVHRAIPVGRMANLTSIIPDAKDYLNLMVSMLEQSKDNRLKVHLHHSIESIHATLLLGLNTYADDKIGNPDAGSSLGIEPEGSLVFDPWCTSGIWKTLSSGSIYEKETNFSKLIDSNNGTVFDLAKIYTAPHLRCNGCEKECSGGSRITAAARILNELDVNEINDSHILSAMTAMDPACPLFYLRERE